MIKEEKIMAILRNIILFIIFFGICNIWAQKSDDDQLKKLDLLTGTWQSESDDMLTIEHWNKVSQNTFEGHGKTIDYSSSETKSYESLRIVAMLGEVFYLAKVSHNEFPIPFKLIESSDSLFIFENQNHDFPKQIEYLFTDKNNMSVKVGSGEKHFTIRFIKKEN